MTRGALALALSVAAVLAGCASSTRTESGAASAAGPLSGVCPSTVVVQTQWEPEAELGFVYQMLGPDQQADPDRKRVVGSLVSGATNTGVRLEIRAGGAAIGFTPIPARRYVDRSITLGIVHDDVAISTSASQPVVTVMAPMAKSPIALMWDPAPHPEWRGIADIGRSRATVLVTGDNIYPKLLLAKALFNPAQIDAGYNGSPARFIADPTVVPGVVVTHEPYVAVRAGDLSALSGCLRRLVPIIQRAQADYLANPGPTNQLIVDLVNKYDDGWTYSLNAANYAATTMKRFGIVANDTTGPLGGIDLNRVQGTIDVLAPALAREGAAVRPGLKPTDLATTEFIDPAIKIQ